MTNTRNGSKLNYIQLINQFWNTNLEHNFTGNESKLYFYLLHVSNSLGWKNPFRNSLRQIHNGTGISINSIKAAQCRLADSGLISINVGTSGNRFDYNNKTEYYLSVSIFDTGADTDPDTGADTATDTINKLNKTKQVYDYSIENYPDKNEEEKADAGEERFNFKDSLLNLGVEEKIVSDWLAVRKKRATNSETAFIGLKKQIEISGMTANDCIKMAVENSWSGFRAEWVDKVYVKRELEQMQTTANHSYEPVNTMQR